MVVSKLIEMLQNARDQYGDLDVVAEIEMEYGHPDTVALNPNFFGERVIYIFESEQPSLGHSSQ